MRSAAWSPMNWWQEFRKRGHLLSESDNVSTFFTLVVTVAIVYSTFCLPLTLVFHQARYAGQPLVDGLADLILLLDVLVGFRTTYFDHGYEVTDWRQIATRYLCGWGVVDIVAAIPFTSLASRTALDASTRVASISTFEWFSLLRILSVGRLSRVASRVLSSPLLSRSHVVNVLVSVAMLMGVFLLFAHWLGLMWYLISIRPLEENLDLDEMKPWFWTEDVQDTSVLYICSLYWALSVMTNLKGLPAHESRQCLWADPALVPRPFAERTYTIGVFVFGAVCYSIIYGNITSFIADLYASRLRFRKMKEELEEYAVFHRIPPKLRAKLQHYVAFKWAVTKGIEMETMAGGLPAHLQLEVRLQLYKPMVEKVAIFAGCPASLFDELVAKLLSLVVQAGDYVFYEGEVGSRMYFVQRGIAEVRLGGGDGPPLATLKDGDYFGELALLTDQRRTTDIFAKSDLMLSALTSEDLYLVLENFPEARPRIEAAAMTRVQELVNETEKNNPSATDGEDGDSYRSRQSISFNASICRGPAARRSISAISPEPPVEGLSISTPACRRERTSCMQRERTSMMLDATHPANGTGRQVGRLAPAGPEDRKRRRSMDRSSALMTGNVRDAAAAHAAGAAAAQSQDQYAAVQREVSDLSIKLDAMNLKLDRLVAAADGRFGMNNAPSSLMPIDHTSNRTL